MIKLSRRAYKKLKKHNDTLMQQRQETPVMVKIDQASSAMLKEKFGESPKVDVSIPKYAYIQAIPYNNRVHKPKVKAKAKATPKVHYTTFVKNYL